MENKKKKNTDEEKKNHIEINENVSAFPFTGSDNNFIKLSNVITQEDNVPNIILTRPSLFSTLKLDTDNDFLNKIISIPFSSSSIAQQINLQEEITKIKKEFGEKLKELEEEKTNKENIHKELRKIQDQLKSKEKISHILTRICEEARKKLFESDDFKSHFENASNCNSVVVSIDIRRSTELMLKARKPELFAKFITELSQKLSEIIISNYGVFDKFTGDGILAFFPDFYSGENAIYFALKAARECHEIFKQHYNNSRDCFNVFIKNIGLGIGIDYGNVTIVNNSNELTVVGIPVVYACRMSGANAGCTILNQPAMEHVLQSYSQHARIQETEIHIKNEGDALGYNVELNEKALNIPKPNWDRLISKKTKK